MGIIRWLDNNLEKIFLVAMLVLMSILIMFSGDYEIYIS